MRTLASSGPAAREAKKQAPEFAEQVQKVAPDAHPHDNNWKPGGAPAQAVTWAVKALAKAGTLSIIGVYPQTVEFFPLGTAMNKNLSLRMGNCNHRKYLGRILDLVRTGAVDPTRVLTQHEPLTAALDAYRAFDTRQPGWIKVELTPAQLS